MKVSFLASVRDETRGEKSIEVAGAESVRALIELLGVRYGEPFREFLLADETCLFLVNGGSIAMTGGLNTKLGPGDSVDILPFVDGG